MTNTEYNTLYAATFLFWTRIMKEHAIFIESSLPPTQNRIMLQAKFYHNQYARILKEVILLSNGVLTKEMLASGQFYTDFTQTAERDFEKFFGVTANVGLTALEQRIASYKPNLANSPQLRSRFAMLNKRLLDQTESFLIFQNDVLNKRYLCELFFGMYPSALNHLMNEAKRFVKEMKMLESIYESQSDGYIAFWNQGMSEHAKSLRGEFDWTQVEEIRAANHYAILFDELSAAAPDRAKSLDTNTKFGDFAAWVTQNLLACNLKGIMSGLYCDHLFREVNHFGFLLHQTAN